MHIASISLGREGRLAWLGSAGSDVNMNMRNEKIAMSK